MNEASIQNICEEIVKEIRSPSWDANLIATMLKDIWKIIEDEKKPKEEK